MLALSLYMNTVRVLMLYMQNLKSRNKSMLTFWSGYCTVKERGTLPVLKTAHLCKNKYKKAVQVQITPTTVHSNTVAQFIDGTFKLCCTPTEGAHSTKRAFTLLTRCTVVMTCTDHVVWLGAMDHCREPWQLQEQVKQGVVETAVEFGGLGYVATLDG